MAFFTLPSNVLTHLKAGFLALERPPPVTSGLCVHPALATALKQTKPSDQTVQLGYSEVRA